MPDENDIIFNQYGIDIVAVVKAVSGFFGGSDVTIDGIVEWVVSAWSTFVVVSYLFALLFLVAYIYAAFKDNRLGDIVNQEIKDKEHLYQQLYGGVSKQSRMDDLEQHIASDNPNDWKLAIIEADIELERALENAGYTGATLGDRLKNARATANLQTIDDAWDAHLVRNKIAHQGADFVLTKKIASETVTKYKRAIGELMG